MLSDQKLIELANAVGWAADEEYGHEYGITGVGTDGSGNPRVEVGFTDMEHDDREQFVVNLVALGEFWYREMVQVISDDGEWIVSASPRAIASMVFNA